MCGHLQNPGGRHYRNNVRITTVPDVGGFESRKANSLVWEGARRNSSLWPTWDPSCWVIIDYRLHLLVLTAV